MMLLNKEMLCSRTNEGSLCIMNITGGERKEKKTQLFINYESTKLMKGYMITWAGHAFDSRAPD